MNAAEQLREALHYANAETRLSPAVEKVLDAARTIALPILEADPELVERIRQVMNDYQCDDDAPLAILAALITTDEET